MSKHPIERTSVSALVGLPVMDAQGAVCGHVHEFAVDAVKDAEHVIALLLKTKRGGAPSMVGIEVLEMHGTGGLRLRAGVLPEIVTTSDQFLLLERDLLDQQIIDVNGHKVVRVNDVGMMWEPVGDEASSAMKLRIVEVEVGLRGAVRRLLKGMPQTAVDKVAEQFPAKAIPWDFVDLIDRDPARRVRLKIEQDRLSRMHPSDIADILEELAPAEREALFTSLDEETAAEALEEVQPKLQKALLEGMDSERVAGIVEEMDPGAAADLLAELTEERSEAILEEMDPEERQEVEELLEFPENSAAGRMTTEYVALAMDKTVAEAIEALREFEGDTETVSEIFLVDTEQKLVGVIPLARLLLAKPEAKMSELSDGRAVSCGMTATGKQVAELFDKYNLRSLPVVDEAKQMVGVVHAEQVIALLRAEQ